MAQLDPNYTSPWARWALLIDDHPHATHTFSTAKGTDLGIPNAFGGADHYCVCTIDIGDGRTYTAWKEIVDAKGQKIDKGTAEDWNKIQPKALGRALKRAGYPDNTLDLKAMLAWRNRNAEISAVRQTLAPPQPAPIAELETAPAEPDDAPPSPDADDYIDVDEETGEILNGQHVDAEAES